MEADIIKVYASQGLSIREIAKIVGVSYSAVQRCVKKNGIECKKKYESGRCKSQKYLDNHEEIYALRKEKVSYKEISGLLGIPRSYIEGLCRANGYGGCVCYPSLTHDEIISRLKEVGREYLSGYRGTHSKIKVRCMVCGGVYERRFDNLLTRARGSESCPVCIERTRKQKNEQEQEAKREARINAERRKMEREADLISRQEEARLANHVCKNCGAVYCIGVTGYNSKRYCSKKCMKRWAMRVKNDRRLKRIQTRDHDNDITLEKLFVRDNGVCYICGGMCNWASVDQEGNAQEEYPSIDHVVPLSKGGKHKWDNVKLAHRGCNTRKGARYMPLG